MRAFRRQTTDGEIIDGVVDESMATGESVSIDKTVGDDTFLAQIIRLVEEAQSSKVPIQEFSDRIAAYFVPGVIIIALASFAFWLVFSETLRPVLTLGASFQSHLSQDSPESLLGSGLQLGSDSDRSTGAVTAYGIAAMIASSLNIISNALLLKRANLTFRKSA